MDRQRVLEALDVLKAELAQSDDLGDDARSALARLADDVHRLTHGADVSHQGADPPSLTAIQETLVEFESEHPKLAGAINQVAAALANLGI